MAYTPIILGSGVAGYAFLDRTRSTQQKLFADSAEIQRDLKTFTEQIAEVQTPDDLMDDFSLFRVALGAFGLDEDIGNRGFIKKVLESDTQDPQSFVNRLSDTRYLEFAEAFGFGGSAGPQLDELDSVDAIKQQVQALSSADDLLADTALLRAALDTFSLGDDVPNTYFLKQVLESDVSDPDSFANRLSDTRYAQLAEGFGFGARAKERESIFGFAEQFSAELGNISNANDLLDRPELMEATFKLFGLEGQDASDETFWRNVLNSDVTDESSFANRQDDERYAAIARGFGFGDEDTVFATDSKLAKFVDAVSARSTPFREVSDFFSDFSVLLSSFDFLDLPLAGRATGYASRVFSSDPSDPNALINLEPDQRYAALYEAINFQPVESGRTYPDGFADAIAQRYVDNQFEIAVGEQDGSMRIALSLESTLGDVVENGTTEDSMWYGVMASGPLRAVFEAVFSLPDSFGTLDVDDQLTIFKDRSEGMFGTSDLAVLNTPDTLNELRETYLFRSDLAVQGTSSSASLILSLL